MTASWQCHLCGQSHPNATACPSLTEAALAVSVPNAAPRTPQPPSMEQFEQAARKAVNAARMHWTFRSHEMHVAGDCPGIIAAVSELTALYRQAREDSRRLDALEQLVLNDLTDAHVFCRAGDGDEPDAIHIEVDGETVGLDPTLRAAIDAALRAAASQAQPEDNG